MNKRLIAGGSAMVMVVVGWAGTTWALSDGPVPPISALRTAAPSPTGPQGATSTAASSTTTTAPPSCAQTVAAWPVARRVAQLLMVEDDFGAP
ncbi:MAG: hypothetical protein M3137_00890, partial [Actinomycetota bacterium]|nr:hypothetical protein [Actinomycetota bacterium]